MSNPYFFCSFSGGKDSCLALHRAFQEGGRPGRLFTMLDETGKRSRSHALPPAVLERQAASMGIPLHVACATWVDYEGVFSESIRNFKKEGLETGVFGDIDLDAHREWVEKICRAAGITPYLPLWKESRRGLLSEFLDLGFKAMIIAVNSKVLSKKLLGLILDHEVIAEIEKAGADAAGENGEYHTVVLDGPLFAHPVSLKTGEISMHEGFWFLEIFER